MRRGSQTQVALITGANSGVGFALAGRLLSDQSRRGKLHICLACRNLKKAEQARMALLARYSGAMVSVLELDLMDPLSVVNASKDFKKRLACLLCHSVNF